MNEQNPRRRFFKAACVLGASTFLTPKPQLNARQNLKPQTSKIASIIDLGLCDGCKHKLVPDCVRACKDKNAKRFPKPIENIPNYFPRKVREDYSNFKDDISRLSPYNFTYVESLEFDGREIFIPRRCMHCDDPTCAKLCPFGVISKDKNGAVDIDEKFCFGGAKCRDVCPWGIPQRQAGVGIYLKIAPKLAGGGAMFKCDMCADLLAKNEASACQSSCKKGAIIFGEREEITKKAQNLAQKYKGTQDGTFIYGDIQNGGTSTFYVSPVPFEKISEILNKKHGFNESLKQKTGIPHLNLKVNNFVNDDSALVKTTLFAPLIGLMAGAFALAKTKDKNETK